MARAKVANVIESLRCMVRPFALTLASSSPTCHSQKSRCVVPSRRLIPHARATQNRSGNDKPLLLLTSEVAVTPEHHFPVDVLHDAVQRQPQNGHNDDHGEDEIGLELEAEGNDEGA